MRWEDILSLSYLIIHQPSADSIFFVEWESWVTICACSCVKSLMTWLHSQTCDFGHAMNTHNAGLQESPVFSWNAEEEKKKQTKIGGWFSSWRGNSYVSPHPSRPCVLWVDPRFEGETQEFPFPGESTRGPPFMRIINRNHQALIKLIKIKWAKPSWSVMRLNAKPSWTVMRPNAKPSWTVMRLNAKHYQALLAIEQPCHYNLWGHCHSIMNHCYGQPWLSLSNWLPCRTGN